jgi:hypothetical protein
MFGFVAGGKIKILCRRLLRFLDEAVEQHHAAPLIHIKKNTGNAVPKICTDLIDPVAEGPAYGHANGPAKLNRHDVRADLLALCAGQALEPFPDGFSTRLSPEENCGDTLLPHRRFCHRSLLFALGHRRRVYHNWYMRKESYGEAREHNSGISWLLRLGFVSKLDQGRSCGNELFCIADDGRDWIGLRREAAKVDNGIERRKEHAVVYKAQGPPQNQLQNTFGNYSDCHNVLCL